MSVTSGGRVVAVIPIAGRPLLEVQTDLKRMTKAFRGFHVRATPDGMGWEVVDLDLEGPS